MDHESQAAAFLDFYARYGGPWEDAFTHWSVSKDFRPADAAAIRATVHAELVARADLVLTDPMEVLG
jgi:hypothetical protein